MPDIKCYNPAVLIDGLFSAVNVDHMVVHIIRVNNIAFVDSALVLLAIQNNIPDVVQIGCTDFLVVSNMLNINHAVPKIVEGKFLDYQIGSAYIDNENFPSAMQNAYQALYICSKERLRVYLYNHSDDVLLSHDQACFIYQFLQEGRLALAYQPVVSSSNGAIEYYEALLRIIDHNGAYLSVGPYISSAEYFNFIEDLDMVALHKVVETLEKYPKLYLSVNVSVLSLKSSNWFAKLQQLLLNFPTVKGRLIIEITETEINNELDKIALAIDKLKSLECQVAIDDFGAGYTSFTQLKIFNIDAIKIDGNFIQDLLSNPDSVLFVELLQKFAKAHCLKTVAEFVENGEIARKAMEMGIDCLQGYYFGKPQIDLPL